jgi:hypothetical protein
MTLITGDGGREMSNTESFYTTLPYEHSPKKGNSCKKKTLSSFCHFKLLSQEILLHFFKKYLGRVVEEGVDFLEAAVGFDGFGALRVGTHQLLKYGAGHSGVLLFEV